MITRIAGYFSSSILEVAGETLDSVERTVWILCNSHLEAEAVKTARAAMYHSLQRKWCGKIIAREDYRPGTGSVYLPP